MGTDRPAVTVTRGTVTADRGLTVDGAASVAERVARWRSATTPLTAASLAGTVTYVHPTIDLDHDKVPDVAVLTTAPPTLTCLSGASGRSIRSLALGDAHAVQPMAADWASVVIATTTESQPGPTDPPHDVTLALTRADGCVRRWTTSFTGRVYAPGTTVATDLPFFRGLLANGSGTDLLVEQQTLLAPPSHHVVRTSATILSGEDGSTLTATDPEEVVDQDPTLVALPDLTGDGRGEYLTALRHQDAGPVLTKPDQVVAHDAADGSTLWSQELTNDFDTAARAVGDVTGDAVTDVVVGTVVSPVDSALLDGATGEVLWTRPGQVPQVLGHDGRGPLISIDSIIVGAHVRYEVATYDSHGTRLYRASRDLGPSDGLSGVSVAADTLGDVERDGFIDTAYSVIAGHEDGSGTTASWTLSGRTGRTRSGLVHALKPDDARPGTGTIDGRGDDVWAQSGDRLALRSGDAFTSLASGAAPAHLLAVTVTQVDTASCPDLVALVVHDEARAVVAVSGSTGAVVWSAPHLPAALSPTIRPGLASCGRTPAREPRPLPSTGGSAEWPAVLLLGAACATARVRRQITGCGRYQTSASPERLASNG